jgi:cysteine desulfurase
MRRIYLDHNATTPVDPRVSEAMAPLLHEVFGNPSSLHWFGQQARGALDEARGHVASLIGAATAEIVFTGSGSEADNAALTSVALSAAAPRRKVVHSTIEHHAVLNCARALADEGFPIAATRSGSDGRIDLEELRSKVDEQTALVAVMLANNETGVVQPVQEAAAIAHAKGALFLCDAVQAAGKIPFDVKELDVDLLALSAHKICGPKGTGALFVRRGVKLRPFVRGGSQERGRRAGTENVAGIVGFGRAAAIAREDLTSGEPRRIEALRDRLETMLLSIPGAVRNGEAPRLPNTANISFAGIEAESLLMALDLAGVAVSTGAACAAGAMEPSHVLRAMGLPPERVQASIRFSLGRTSTEDDVARAGAAVSDAVTRQRVMAGSRAR